MNFVFECLQQDRQCTYYLTLRRFHETTAVMEKLYYIS